MGSRTSFVWICAIILVLGLAGIFSLKAWVVHSTLAPAASPNAISNSGPGAGNAGSAGKINAARKPAAMTTVSPTVIIAEPGSAVQRTMTTANTSIKVQAAPQPNQPLLNRVPQSEAPTQKMPATANTNMPEASQPLAEEHQTVQPINAPMTDQQILDSIQRQNQTQQAWQDISAKRDEIASQVVQQAAATKNQTSNTQTVIPSRSPTPPPPDIQAKLRSHQLTAH